MEKKPIVFIELTNRRKVPESDKRKAYYTLGLLSTSFSELEQRLQNLLVCFMRFDTPVGIFYVERNTMENNLQLLQNINKWIKDVKLTQIITKTSAIKVHRNNLIHGTWELAKRNSDRGLIIYVTKAKPFHYKGEPEGRANVLTSATTYPYEFAELGALITSIDEIIVLLKEANLHYEQNRPYM